MTPIYRADYLLLNFKLKKNKYTLCHDKWEVSNDYVLLCVIICCEYHKFRVDWQKCVNLVKFSVVCVAMATNLIIRTSTWCRYKVTGVPYICLTSTRYQLQTNNWYFTLFAYKLVNVVFSSAYFFLHNFRNIINVRIISWATEHMKYALEARLVTARIGEEVSVVCCVAVVTLAREALHV